MINSIQSKSTVAVKVALDKQLAAYTNAKFTKTTIFTDGKGAVVAMTDYLQSICIMVNLLNIIDIASYQTLRRSRYYKLG
jgi:hypothetical protein